MLCCLLVIRGSVQSSPCPNQQFPAACRCGTPLCRESGVSDHNCQFFELPPPPTDWRNAACNIFLEREKLLSNNVTVFDGRLELSNQIGKVREGRINVIYSMFIHGSSRGLLALHSVPLVDSDENWDRIRFNSSPGLNSILRRNQICIAFQCSNTTIIKVICVLLFNRHGSGAYTSF